VSNNKNKPIREIRIGNIKASIWEIKSDKVVRHHVSLSRICEAGDDWTHSDSFACDDLLVVARVVDLAHAWICKQGRLRL